MLSALIKITLQPIQRPFSTRTGGGRKKGAHARTTKSAEAKIAAKAPSDFLLIVVLTLSFINRQASRRRASGRRRNLGQMFIQGILKLFELGQFTRG